MLRRAPRRVARGRGSGVPPRPPRDPRAPRPPGARALTAPHRPGRVRRPDRLPAPGDPALQGLGRRPGGGRAPARGGGAEAHREGGLRPRGHARDGLHRIPHLALRRDVPARARVGHRRRLPGLRRPLEPDHRRVRRRGRAVRARGAPERDRLRLLDHAPHARGHRAPPRLRPQLGSEPHDVAGHRPCGLPPRLRRPDLPRARQGHARHVRRSRWPARIPPPVGQPAPGLGLRLGRPRRRPVRARLPGPAQHRLRRTRLRRVGGCGDGPPARSTRRPRAGALPPLADARQPLRLGVREQRADAPAATSADGSTGTAGSTA